MTKKRSHQKNQWIWDDFDFERFAKDGWYLLIAVVVVAAIILWVKYT